MPSAAVVPPCSGLLCFERAKTGRLGCCSLSAGNQSGSPFAVGLRMEHPAGLARHPPIAVVPKELQGVKSGLSMRPPTDDLEPINLPQSYTHAGERNMCIRKCIDREGLHFSILLPLMKDRTIDVWPEFFEYEGCAIQAYVGQPALASLRPAPVG